MAEIGNLSKMLQQRIHTFAVQTSAIFKKIEDRLTPAFQRVFEAPDRRIVWTGIDSLDGTDRAILVSGYMGLKVGDIISIQDQTITIDEKNVNEYNKFVKFAFPIIMLELASVDELVEHMNRMSKIVTAMDVPPEQLAKMLDKIADAFETKLLNDPTKIDLIDSVTKPESVLGFEASALSDEQIRKLKLYEKHEIGTLN